jgi:hypothetical protein
VCFLREHSGISLNFTSFSIVYFFNVICLPNLVANIVTSL